MALHFRYTPIKQSDGTTSEIPIIPITILQTEHFFAHALIDSGADMCAMFKPTAELMGIPLDGRREKSRGIGGLVETIHTELAIKIEQGKEKYIFRMPFKIILVDEELPILLGQEGFFDKFIIKFNKKKNKFSLKRAGKIF